jgi:hypothetical protein
MSNRKGFVQLWGYTVVARDHVDATRLANIKLMEAITNSIKKEFPCISESDIIRMAFRLHSDIKISFDTSECKVDSWE